MKKYSIRFRQGFTLAELLIVVAIIGVLVAISVPIFSGQLEKSRDAVSIANMRSAYSEAMNYCIEYNGADVSELNATKLPSGYRVDLDNGDKVWINTNGNVSAVQIAIDVESHQANNWSGLADQLPFNLMTDSNANTASYEGGDDGKPSTGYRTWRIIFRFDFTFKDTGGVTEAAISHS